MKLYRVNLAGFQGKPMKSPMVISTDPTAAYSIVREWLDKNDYGLRRDREMVSIELIADTDEYTEAPARLFLENASDKTRPSNPNK